MEARKGSKPDTLRERMQWVCPDCGRAPGGAVTCPGCGKQLSYTNLITREAWTKRKANSTTGNGAGTGAVGNVATPNAAPADRAVGQEPPITSDTRVCQVCGTPGHPGTECSGCGARLGHLITRRAWEARNPPLAESPVAKSAAEKTETGQPPAPETEPAVPSPRPDKKVCPRCAEEVKFAAQVCRFCGHSFGTPDPELAAPSQTTSGIAFASFITSLLGLWVASIPLGIYARRVIDRSKGRLVGRGFAATGIVLGFVGIVATGVAIGAFALGPSSTPTGNQSPVSNNRARTDQSQSIQQYMQSSSTLHNFLQQGYSGSSVNVRNVQCIEHGTNQTYSCTVSYTVSGASDAADNGSYQIGANANCDTSGNCQWQTDPLGPASKQ